jgi:DNA-binding NtrC family response regulator
MNLCERLVVMSDKSRIDAEDLFCDVLAGYTEDISSNALAVTELSLKDRLDSMEKEILRNAMMRHGTQSRAAAALGVNQATIARKLKRHRIRNTSFAD